MHHLNPWLRLVIHFGCGAVLAIWGGVAIHNVGNLLAMGDIPLLFMTIPLTALSFAGTPGQFGRKSKTHHKTVLCPCDTGLALRR